ncbi:MAG: methyltransferase domain-containing protein [Planctomycetota bacterium]
MDVERLPFDQYQRYRLVSDLVGEVRPPGKRLRILDVGGRTALLRDFLPADRVDLVDMEPAPSPGLVLGDGSRLPFMDGAFDVVAAFDTLEHVPPQARAAFVAECARVSRGYVMIAGPYQTARVEEAEEAVLVFLEQKLGIEHRYLREHRAYGLPDRAETEGVLAAAGLTVKSFGHANLDRWILLMCLEFYVDYDPTLRELGQRIFKFYNATLYASDHIEPVYRHVVIGAVAGAPMPEASKVLAPPGAPREALPAFLPLAQELLAFDHQRDALRPELERLHQVVRSLEEDLRQHDEAQRTVEADLTAHRATVVALRAELDRERAANACVQRDLEADLAGNRATVAALRADIEGLRAGLAQHEALQSDLAREIEVRGAALDEHRARLRDLESELVAARADLARERAAASADLAGARAEAKALRSELEQHHGLRSLLESTLEEHRDLATRHGNALLDREARVDDLHAELTAAFERARAAEVELDALREESERLVRLLRSRLGNLGRAFAPRKFGDPT